MAAAYKQLSDGLQPDPSSIANKLLWPIRPQEGRPILHDGALMAQTT